MRAFALPLFHAATLPLAVACGTENGGTTQAGAASAADSADHVMQTVKTILTSEGVKSAVLEADTAYMFEAQGRTDLRNIKVAFFSTTGIQQSTLTAAEGVYFFRTNAMEARGNVVVVKADGSRLLTEELKFDQASNKVTTDRPYTYISGDRTVQGNGFVSDPSFSNITTQGVRGTGGRFSLPGQ